MYRAFGFLIAAIFAVGAAGGVASAAPKDPPKKQKGTFQAQRAGWLLGMYVGEERDRPYPFVTEVDPESEAGIKGVKPGDELIRLDGEETSPLRRLFDRVNDLRPGLPVMLWVRRGTETLRFELRVPRPLKPGEEKASKKPKGDAKGDQAAEGDKNDKKKKKKPPVVIKPIPPADSSK